MVLRGAQNELDYTFNSAQPTASFRAVIPAKAGIQIFPRRKPGTRLDPVFQRGDEGAPDPRFRGENSGFPFARE